MTLPFRRRHHDHEASHDRARAIVAMGFLEPTEPGDAAWLEAHLIGCGECRIEIEAYRADRELLRGLRTSVPEPPRDLWARTAASIEREAGRHDRTARAPVDGRRIGRVPLGVLAGVLVVLVVVGTSLVPRGIGPTVPAGSAVAVASPPPEPTPLAVTAKTLTWVQEGGDGTFQVVFANVSQVCAAASEACAPFDNASTPLLTLPSEPQAVVLSPTSEQLIVVSAATSSGGGEVLVVPVPTPEPSASSSASSVMPPTPAPTEPAPTEPAPTTPAPTEPAPTLTATPDTTEGPGENPAPSASPSGSPDPNDSWSILSGVIVVGEAAYSADGRWLAFSARPIDGSAGPDLYLWRVGDPVASAVTADRRTFFAGWFGNLVLASRVEPIDTPSLLELPAASDLPPVDPTPTPEPDQAPKPGDPKPDRTPKAGGPKQGAAPSPTPSPVPATEPSGSPEPTPTAAVAPVENHPVSFLLDPETGTVTGLAGHDIWRPVVDPTSRAIVYWSGTLVPDGTGTGWALGTGRLLLDGWIAPVVTPMASPDPSASADATATPEASLDSLASATPPPEPGPVGSPVVLAEGPLADFEASFDPTGTRLAVWIRDPVNADVGTLRLVALDPETGGIVEGLDPLPGVAALRGFSIGENRLAWVTPPGQDGEPSHVQVLAWTGDEFGQAAGVAVDGLLVVR